MKRIAVLFSLSLFAAVVTVQEVEAQTFSVGPQLSLWDIDNPALGVRADVGFGEMLGLEGALSDWTVAYGVGYLLNSGDRTRVSIDANSLLPLSPRGSLTPYVGAGLNLFYLKASNGDTDITPGLNLVGGSFLDVGLPAFVQVQYSPLGAGGDSGVSFALGVLFGR